MDKAVYYADQKKANTDQLINSDTFFTNEQKRNPHPLVQSAIRAQYRIGVSIQEIQKEDPVKSGSDGYWETAGKKGPFTLVRRAKL